MRIFVNDVIESNITQQELHDACILKLYLARLSLILGLYLFTSSQTCSRYFNDVKHLKQIYRWYIYFGPSMVCNLLLNGKKFYLPKTRLDPTLRLQLNSLHQCIMTVFLLLKPFVFSFIAYLIQIGGLTYKNNLGDTKAHFAEYFIIWWPYLISGETECAFLPSICWWFKCFCWCI